MLFLLDLVYFHLMNRVYFRNYKVIMLLLIMFIIITTKSYL